VISGVLDDENGKMNQLHCPKTVNNGKFTFQIPLFMLLQKRQKYEETVKKRFKT